MRKKNKTIDNITAENTYDAVVYAQFNHADLGNVHKELGISARTAVICTVGSVVTVITDMVWLIGDLMVAPHFHHYIVMVGLGVGAIVSLWSLIWVIRLLKLSARYANIKS